MFSVQYCVYVRILGYLPEGELVSFGVSSFHLFYASFHLYVATFHLSNELKYLIDLVVHFALLSR